MRINDDNLVNETINIRSQKDIKKVSFLISS